VRIRISHHVWLHAPRCPPRCCLPAPTGALRPAGMIHQRQRPRLGRVSAPREELHRLIDALPEETVPVVLAELRGRTAAANRPWPPRWFGAAEARQPNVSERADEILREELGQRRA